MAVFDTALGVGGVAIGVFLIVVVLFFLKAILGFFVRLVGGGLKTAGKVAGVVGKSAKEGSHIGIKLIELNKKEKRRLDKEQAQEARLVQEASKDYEINQTLQQILQTARATNDFNEQKVEFVRQAMQDEIQRLKDERTQASATINDLKAEVELLKQQERQAKNVKQEQSKVAKTTQELAANINKKHNLIVKQAPQVMETAVAAMNLTEKYLPLLLKRKQSTKNTIEQALVQKKVVESMIQQMNRGLQVIKKDGAALEKVIPLLDVVLKVKDNAGQLATVSKSIQDSINTRTQIEREEEIIDVEFEEVSQKQEQATQALGAEIAVLQYQGGIDKNEKLAA